MNDTYIMISKVEYNVMLCLQQNFQILLQELEIPQNICSAFEFECDITHIENLKNLVLINKEDYKKLIGIQQLFFEKLDEIKSNNEILIASKKLTDKANIYGIDSIKEL